MDLASIASPGKNGKTTIAGGLLEYSVTVQKVEDIFKRRSITTVNMKIQDLLPIGNTVYY